MVNSINHESNVCHVNVFLLLVAAQSLQADWLALFIFLGQTLILIPAKSNTYCSHWFHSEGHSPFFAASMFAVHHHGVTREEAGMNSSGPEGGEGGSLRSPQSTTSSNLENLLQQEHLTSSRGGAPVQVQKVQIIQLLPLCHKRTDD